MDATTPRGEALEKVAAVFSTRSKLAGCEVIQYTPNQVKAAVAGWGAADKAQVQKMVQARLGLTTLPKPADAADAAALALCHLAMSPLSRTAERSA